MSETVLSACDLEKSWRQQRVLNKASLDLRLGRVTAVLGPSGAGKSTLLRCIAGLERIDAGEIRSGETLIASAAYHTPPEKRGVGLVFQDFALFPHLTALQNVMFGIRGLGKHERRERARQMLATARLEHKANSYPHALSGGEQQRVALARALAPQPKLVLLDEAFSGLDARLRDELRETTLAALKESGAAVLIVTHDAEEAMFMADDLALMTEGRIIQAGAPDAVYLNPVSAAAARLLGEINEWPGKAEGGAFATPFGNISANGHAEGQNGAALVRPEGLILTESAEGRFEIVARRPAGAETMMLVRAANGAVWRARAPLSHAPAQGAKVSIEIDPTLARVTRG